MDNKLKRFLLDLFFPKTCLGCKKEKTYLCQDCESILDISYTHKQFKNPHLNDLYIATSYKNRLVKKLINLFKNQPFVKELGQNLSQLMIHHFQLIELDSDKFKDFAIIPVPPHVKVLKWRGFNHAEELAKPLAEYLEIPLMNDVLMKTRQTKTQTGLSKEKRRQNVENAFSCINEQKIKNKNILLVDDLYLTGATITECAKTLKHHGARIVTGTVVAIDAN